MLNVDRRLFCKATFGLFVSQAFAETINAAETYELPPIPDKYATLADEPPMNEEFANVLNNQGTSAPDDEEIAVERDIVAAAPTHCDPYEVATFFAKVARGGYGQEWRPYTRAWPRDAPANPLILAFFSRTDTKPAGDTTAWCAAFVNWCLIEAAVGAPIAQASPPTKSASSGSFRNWGKTYANYDAISNKLIGSLIPRPGDIAVFQDMNNGEPDPHHGHVAFFVSMTDSHVTVLGGNQFEGDPIVHAINVKSLPKRGSLQLHSIRSDPSLHR